MVIFGEGGVFSLASMIFVEEIYHSVKGIWLPMQTVLGSIPASCDTMEYEERQMKRC